MWSVPSRPVLGNTWQHGPVNRGGDPLVSSKAELMTGREAAEHVPAEVLACRQGVQPVASVDDLARPDLFESDDELNVFLANLYAARLAGMA
jgi:hypothetical protein